MTIFIFYCFSSNINGVIYQILTVLQIEICIARWLIYMLTFVRIFTRSTYQVLQGFLPFLAIFTWYFWYSYLSFYFTLDLTLLSISLNQVCWLSHFWMSDCWINHLCYNFGFHISLFHVLYVDLPKSRDLLSSNSWIMQNCDGSSVKTFTTLFIWYNYF